MNKLNWDSSFFGINIAKSEFNSVSSEDLRQLIKSMRDQQIDLCYLFTDIPIDPKFHASYHITYHSQKIEFTKDIHNIPDNDFSFISSYSSQSIVSDSCIQISRQAGHHSRFKLDPKFPNGSFEKLYDEWIIQSIRRKLADEVLVVKYQEDVAGLITLKKNENNVVIGLLGVDERLRGRKMGQSLVKMSEIYTKQNGISTLNVSTQVSNSLAVSFYEKTGFKRSYVKYIYHIWLDNK